jgi:hypothetical protein
MDSWIQGSSIRYLAPAVFEAVPKRKWGVTVTEALHDHAWVHHFTGARTMRLLTKFIGLCRLLEQVQLSPGTPDIFAWKLTASQQYSAASAYGAMFFGCSRPLGARQVWKTSAPPRTKLFFWLVLHKKCWTADRRWRHGLQDGNSCIMCDQGAETMDHIILGCVFSREVWSSCLRTYHLHQAVSVQEQDIMIWWTNTRKLLPKQIRRGFDSLFFLVAWNLWKERNARTFGRTPRQPAELLHTILEEASLWMAAGYRALRAVDATACSK